MTEFWFYLKGDKLLRLPSHTYDTKDLIRNMSVGADGAEGPEEIIEADEYLQPQITGTDDHPRSRYNPHHSHNGKLDKARVFSILLFLMASSCCVPLWP